MKDDILKSKLSKLMEATEDVMIDTQAEEENKEEPTKDNLTKAATAVMASYQNANKWLDIIKEAILMDMGCVFFSNYVHNLAHTMPVRFDAFGDILHTIDMKVPYPATEYIDKEPESIPDSFDKIDNILHSICASLAEFIEVADNNHQRAVAISAENLLSDLSTEFTNLKRMNRALVQSGGDVIKFDKWVAAYVNNLGNLID